MHFTTALLSILAILVSAKWYDRDAKDSIMQELGANLSPHAEMILESDDMLANKTKPWQAWAAPQFRAVEYHDIVETERGFWTRGMQTVTGAGECVGLTAIALGGGHGSLLGY
ncbi:uncharacterized protein CC84DRAFT_1172607 [Paraphaeosphaeria sporulosa]|uniref:Uncharacterized protein n=1 Tax=Paraphaeosphaeria sporulosa TaxID=1460663 RepID=A0A177CTA0_9PLEO|nr:uncharacterized protein CC84DRAFT_1172607 [Paraphaeosphaeria sporulosa]OAG10142.1 hypothetical protein CC84DRAFT_1172607 [Paraphaeosphaeria sporulosa]